MERHRYVIFFFFLLQKSASLVLKEVFAPRSFLDSCLRPSFTPPSSPSPHDSNEQKETTIEFLSSSADPNNWDKIEGLDNPFETVLFSRTEGMPLHLDRSTSFNPRKHWDMASCFFDEHQPARASITPEPAFEEGSKEGNQDSLEILNQLVANRGWDDQKFEHEIFGSPGEAVNLNSELKRIPSKFRVELGGFD
jgi:hypothetical protein